MDWTSKRFFPRPRCRRKLHTLDLVSIGQAGRTQEASKFFKFGKVQSILNGRSDGKRWKVAKEVSEVLEQILLDIGLGGATLLRWRGSFDLNGPAC